MQKNKFNFTMNRLQEIQPPTVKRIMYYDLGQPGLRLLVTPTGNKSFQFQMWSKKHGKPLTQTLGKLDKLSLSEARQMSALLVAEIHAGINVESKLQDERRERVRNPTVLEFAARFISEYRKANGERKKSWSSDKYLLEQKVIPLIGNLRMKEVKRTDLKRVIQEVTKQTIEKRCSKQGNTIDQIRGGKIIANRVLSCVKTMFNYAVEEEIVEYSVCGGIKKIEEKPRERTLSEQEIRDLFKLLDNSLNHKLIKFLLITGQRSSECRAMEWSEIENDHWIIPAERTKTEKTHVVPLSSMALELLSTIEPKGIFVFSCSDKCLSRYYLPQVFRRLHVSLQWDKKITPHDLRRTVKTMMSKLGVKPYISEKILNHSDERMIKVYDKYDYLEEKSLALEKWSKQLRKILASKK